MLGKSKKKSNLTVADRSLSRVINQKAIVDKIYECDGISKAQLAKELGLSKPTVSTNVENLINIGIVGERGQGEATQNGGRKPVMLYFDKDYRYVGALDLSYSQPVCAVADLKHNIIGLKKLQVLQDATSKDRKEQVKQGFLDIMEEQNIPLEKLDTIVISQPGVIQGEGNLLYSTEKHHAWTEIALDIYLKEELDVHVYLRNDVNLAAMGVLHFDCDSDIDNLIYISCGVGLGSGIILNRKLYSGERNAAGEIGLLVTGTGETLEDCVAMDGLIRRIETMYKEKGEPGKVSFTDIVALSKKKDELVNTAIYETGIFLGREIYNCCTLLDIQTVLFGGEYLELGDTLFEGIEEALKVGKVFKPIIKKSGLREIAGIFGCFVIGTDKVMQRVVSL